MGVTWATPWRRARASWISASVGPVSVFNLEHLLHDLADGRERVELPALDLVEQPPEFRIVRHGPLEMRLCARRRDGEDLAGEIPSAPLLEAPLVGEECAVLVDRRPQLVDPLAA